MNSSSEHPALVEQIAARMKAFLGPSARPRVGLVLGSGLGDYAERLTGARSTPYRELGFPSSGVVGHKGNLVHGLLPGTGMEVLAMQGRIHAYEGHSLQTVVAPIRAMIQVGCKVLLLTNAAGAISPGLLPGQLVLLRDHLNLLSGSPLAGPNDDRLGPRFPDMTAVYDRGLRSLAEQVATRMGMALPSGVYAAGLGPQYETPAEIRMLRTLGADLVGMSTVPEAIAARHMGAKVLGISCVTNLAAGISEQPLSHDEVTATAAHARNDFVRLLDGILGGLAAQGHATEQES